MKSSRLHILIAVMLVISCLTANMFCISAENVDTTPIADTTTVNVSKNDSSYSSYLSLHSDADTTDQDIVYGLNNTVLDSAPVEFEVNVPKTGNYYIGMNYKSMDTIMSDFRLGIKIDGAYPYDKAEKIEFPRMWCDEDGQKLVDDLGDEFAAQQVQYKDYFYNEAIDETVLAGDKYIINLKEGTHKITLIPVVGKMEVDYFKFVATALPQKYTTPSDKTQLYKGNPIIIEGENAIVKSNYFLVGQGNTSSTKITPQSAQNSLINYIGGGNWSSVGDTLVWETPELKAGYYKIGFSFSQETVIGGKSYRVLEIDGKVPFAEARQVGFKYDTDWQQSFFEDEKEGISTKDAGTEMTKKVQKCLEKADVEIDQKEVQKYLEESGGQFVFDLKTVS